MANHPLTKITYEEGQILLEEVICSSILKSKGYFLPTEKGNHHRHHTIYKLLLSGFNKICHFHRTLSSKGMKRYRELVNLLKLIVSTQILSDLFTGTKIRENSGIYVRFKTIYVNPIVYVYFVIQLYTVLWSCVKYP